MKDNKTLAGIIGLMVVGSLGLGAYLFTSYSSFSEKRAQWDELSQKVAGLKGKKIYPDQENYESLQAQLQDYSGKVDALRTALSSESVQQVITPISETDFQAKLKQRVSAIRQAATAAGMSLPEVFALGFDEYTGALPRSAEAAADLNVQLDVIDRLVSILIESGVKSLDSLGRTKLPSESAPAAPEPAANNRNAANNRAAAAPVVEKVMERYPITLSITSDQTPFQNVINLIADPVKAKHFLVTQQVKIQNESLEAPLKDEVANRLSQQTPSAAAALEPAAPAEGAAATPATVAVVQPLPADAVTIMGEEKLKVDLVVDYIRFESATEAESEAAEAKEKQ